MTPWCPFSMMFSPPASGVNPLNRDFGVKALESRIWMGSSAGSACDLKAVFREEDRHRHVSRLPVGLREGRRRKGPYKASVRDDKDLTVDYVPDLWRENK